MGIVVVLIFGTFALYCGFFYLLALALQMGTPLDALKAGVTRSGLGLAGTLLSLVVHIFLRLANTSLETMVRASDLAMWAARIGIPTSTIPPMLPVTGQHAIVRSSIGIRVPAVAVEFEPAGPARRRITSPRWVWLVVVAVVAFAIAWWMGGR